MLELHVFGLPIFRILANFPLGRLTFVRQVGYPCPKPLISERALVTAQQMAAMRSRLCQLKDNPQSVHKLMISHRITALCCSRLPNRNHHHPVTGTSFLERLHLSASKSCMQGPTLVLPLSRGRAKTRISPRSSLSSLLRAQDSMEASSSAPWQRRYCLCPEDTA